MTLTTTTCTTTTTTTTTITTPGEVGSGSGSRSRSPPTVSVVDDVDVRIIHKLSQLQNLCKRDPAGFRVEYDAQIRRLESELRLLQMTGAATTSTIILPSSSSSSSSSHLHNNCSKSSSSKSHNRRKRSSTSNTSSGATPLAELMQFAAAVSSSSYKGAESDRIAQMFMALLSGEPILPIHHHHNHNHNHHHHNLNSSPSLLLHDVATVTMSLPSAALHLDRSVRHCAVSCLILMRNKGALATTSSSLTVPTPHPSSSLPQSQPQHHHHDYPTLRLFALFFRLLAVLPDDKHVREVLYKYLAQDVTNLNKKKKKNHHKNHKMSRHSTGSPVVNNKTLINRSVQCFLHRVIEATHHHSRSHDHNYNNDTHPHPHPPHNRLAQAALTATRLTADWYRRRVWNDAHTVAILARAVTSPLMSVSMHALRFFLHIEDAMQRDNMDHEEFVHEQQQSSLGRVNEHLHSRKTASRKRHVERQKKARQKRLRKKEAAQGYYDHENDDANRIHLQQDLGVEASKKLYPAIELLRDPQGLAEAVLKRLRSPPGSVKYEVKLLMMNFCTRLVGNHELMVLPLYPLLAQSLTRHDTRYGTQILCFAVQACHAHVPPTDIVRLVHTIAHEFITERCRPERMAVGINAVRAICARVPSILWYNHPHHHEEEDEQDEAEAEHYDTDDENHPASCRSHNNKNKNKNNNTNVAVNLDVRALCQELATLAQHRDRSVRTAAQSWVNWLRATHPALLRGKSQRGTHGAAGVKAGIQPLRFGEHCAAAGVEGAELLLQYEAQKAAAKQRRRRQQQQQQQEQNQQHQERDENHDDDDFDLDDDDDEIEANLEKIETDSVDEEIDSKRESKDDEEEWEDVHDEADEEEEEKEKEEEEDEEIEIEEELEECVHHDLDTVAPKLAVLDRSEQSTVVESGRSLPAAHSVMDVSSMTPNERDKLKAHVSSTRIFSTRDFGKMRKLVERERRLRTDPREAARRKRALARGDPAAEEWSSSNDDDSSTSSSFDDGDSGDDSRRIRIAGVVDPTELMADAKKKRQSRTEKLERIAAGRTKLEAKSREGGSTNVEKKRKKNFLMSKYSREAKIKRSGKKALGKRKGPKKQLNHEAKKRRRKV